MRQEELRAIAWHALPVETVLRKLGTSARGLAVAEAIARLRAFGPNEIRRREPPRVGRFLARQFFSPLTLLLIAAAAASLLIGDRTNAAVIALTASITILFGFFQEWKSEQALHQLHATVAAHARVVRDAEEREVPARDLVPGDIVRLGEGELVPADLRVIVSHDCLANESLLTGESSPVEKRADAARAATSLAEQFSLLHAGTVVVRGGATGVVVAIGSGTELGKIASSLARVREPLTPLEVASRRLIRGVLGIVAFGIILTVFAGLWRGLPPAELALIVVAVAVASIPEGLTVSVTATLTRGMVVLLGAKALVRRLLAAETLGAVSVLCVDKTGTLTEGVMKVKEVIPTASDASRETILGWLALSIEGARAENPSAAPERWRIVGEPTEAALLTAVVASAASATYRRRNLFDRVPFSSERGFHAAIADAGDGAALVVVGAPERLLAADRTLVSAERRRIMNDLQRCAGEGYRTLGVATVALQSPRTFTLAERSAPPAARFQGFVTLADPVRADAAAVIRAVREAGVRPVMITGDVAATAAAIAVAAGFSRPVALTATELFKKSPAAFREAVEESNVFARVAPDQKLKILLALQAGGHVVAMTGDGVNDAPALKAADIGVVMGSGSDVAKEVADLVLLDNRLATLVRAVSEGRTIFENIRKLVTFLLYSSLTEVITITAAMFFGLPLPLAAAQILWVNVIADTLPAFSLAFEPAEERLLKEPPRPKGEPLLDRRHLAFIVSCGAITAALLFGLYSWLLHLTADHAYAQTMTFAALAIGSTVTVLAFRRLRAPAAFHSWFRNRVMLGALAVDAVALLAALYVPPFSQLFQTVPLALVDWSLLAAFGFANLLVIESLKLGIMMKK